MARFTYALMREGVTDESLRAIVERIAISKNHELVFNEALSKPFNGPLGSNAVRLRTRANFDSNSVDLAFYFADADKGDFNKLESIQQAVESVNAAYLLRSVVGIPSPHFEEWLIADENCVKHIFGLTGDQPVPYSNLQPKRRLEKLSDDCDDILLTPPEARKRLAENLDIDAAQRASPSFGQFVRRYHEYLNSH